MNNYILIVSIDCRACLDNLLAGLLFCKEDKIKISLAEDSDISVVLVETKCSKEELLKILEITINEQNVIESPKSNKVIISFEKISKNMFEKLNIAFVPYEKPMY